MPDRREPRTLVPSWKQAHRRGGLAVNPSQVGFHLIKREFTPIPFTPGREKCDSLQRRASDTCIACSIRLTSQGLSTKEVLRQEQHIGRALCQTPHKVGIPLSAERDVDAHAP